MYCPKESNGENNQKCIKSGGQCPHQRQTNNQMSSTYLNNCNNNPSLDQTRDRTPCGSATLTPNFDESYDTPPYIRWSQDFHYLINDSEGIQLFQKYLKSEGLEQLLDFWFAIEGLKTNETENKEIIRKLINIIYKKFIRNSNINDLSDKVRDSLKHGLTSTPSDTTQSYDPRYDKHIFNSAQNEVEGQLKSAIYTNFLNSDIYLGYLQINGFPNSNMGAVRSGSYDKTNLKDNVSSTIDSSMPSMESSLEYNTQNNQYYDLLPTVDEESELQTDLSVNRSPSSAYYRSQAQNKFQSIPVNRYNNLMSSESNDTLMRGINKILSQRSSDNGSTRVTTESHPLSPNHNRLNSAHQSYMRSKSMANPPNPYHVKYATVHPTSARDSELQSISSHSTNDSMSCISGQDINDSPAIRSKKQSIAIKHNAKLNSNLKNNGNSYTHKLMSNFPPLKALPPPEKDTLNSDEFAKTLIEKLEKLKKEMDSNQKLTEVLNSVYIEANANKSNANIRHLSANTTENSRQNKTLKDVIKEVHKFEFFSSEDNDQEILDKHCAQVFKETPNETPTDSIGRCVSPPKHQNFRTFDYRMTPPVSVPIGGSFDSTQVNVTVRYSTEQIPYRLTLNGPHITLRKFKQQIPPKKGNWQYYFKRKCDDIDISAPYVLEKISDDNTPLPLIDGKIFAELQESN